MLSQSRVWRASETNPVKRYLMEYRAAADEPVGYKKL